MSANVQSMVAGEGKSAWHGIGRTVQGLLTAKEALKEAGMDWRVKLAPMYTEFHGKQKLVDDFQAVVREDNGVTLGTVVDYTPLQNVDAFSIGDGLVMEKDLAMYSTAGVLGKGEKVFITIKLAGVCRILNTEDVSEKYLFLVNSHNGKSSLNVGIARTRIVCENTERIAIDEAKQANKLFKIRHSTQMASKVENAREKLGLINLWFEKFNEKMNILAKTPVNKENDNLNKFLVGMGFDPETESKRELSTIEAIKEGFETSPGSNLVSAKGTVYGLLQSVSYFTDHLRGTRQTSSFGSIEEARSASALFGSGNAMKEKALEVSLQLAGVN